MKFMEWVGAATAAARSEDWPTELTHQTVSFMATEAMHSDKVASMVFVVGAGDARNADTEENRKLWLRFQAKVKAHTRAAQGLRTWTKQLKWHLKCSSE